MTVTNSKVQPRCREELLVLSHAQWYHISNEQRWQSLMINQSLAHQELVD